MVNKRCILRNNTLLITRRCRPTMEDRRWKDVKRFECFSCFSGRKQRTDEWTNGRMDEWTNGAGAGSDPFESHHSFRVSSILHAAGRSCCGCCCCGVRLSLTYIGGTVLLGPPPSHHVRSGGVQCDPTHRNPDRRGSGNMGTKQGDRGRSRG